ncbi:MAG: phosphoribosylformylglycinamidine synthase subunit PurS [Candidatus Aenigmatarchaeota archaeon]|nr:MAG: phosphoribosylformylglycinamidine synthase subunit PurS [Candidatus Aenigmarchaeota archaeon]
MEIEMTVELLVPDTTAITTFHTLERMGFSALKKLKREDYYRFSAEGDFARVSQDLGKVDIIVNANKHRYKAKRAGEAEEDPKTVRVLVQDTDNRDGGLLGTLQERLGFKNIKTAERGVLWSLDFDVASKEAALKQATEAAEKLLSNRHYQEFRII